MSTQPVRRLCHFVLCQTVVCGIAAASSAARCDDAPQVASLPTQATTPGVPSLRFQSPQPQATRAQGWRRTARGWESTDDWFPAHLAPPGLHPVALGCLQLLLSLGSLAALSWDGQWSTLVTSGPPVRRLTR